MNYEGLDDFIRHGVHVEKFDNYCAVMIKTLIQKNCAASKAVIKLELQKTNPEYSEEYFDRSYVFDALTKDNVVEFDNETKTYVLLDYESFSKEEKDNLTKICDNDIKVISDIKSHISDFQRWLKSDEGVDLLDKINDERRDFQKFMEKLSNMDRHTVEFTDHVLYGLLPNPKSKNAKRESMFGMRQYSNFRHNLKKYGYSEDEFNKIANKIYSLASKFKTNPAGLDGYIEEFVSDKYSRGLQTGFISPILFCINDEFPVINSLVSFLYNELSEVLGWKEEKMQSKLDRYIDWKEKVQRLADFLNVDEFKDLGAFSLFFKWFYNNDKYVEWDDEEYEDEEPGNEEYEEPESNKTKFVDVDYKLLKDLKSEDVGKFEPHSLPNPERIKIRQILQHCQDVTWELPDFQRYFDWKKTDIRDLLESIFYDYYIGSLLFWEIDGDPQLATIPILGVSSEDNKRTQLVILDGQQRITSLYYAIKAPGVPTPKIRKPLYFYINFQKFFSGESQDLIVILNEKIPRDETIRKLLFPIYELENYQKWINDFEDLVTDDNDHIKIRNMRRIMEDRLRHFIDGFEIPYVPLPKSMGLDQVSEIFERINTRGKPLSVFDLLVVRLKQHNVPLKDLWEYTREIHPKLRKNPSGKIPIYILQSILLCFKSSSCKRKDVLNIYEKIFDSSDLSFDKTWEEIAKYMSKAIVKLHNLRDGFGVTGLKSLPYLPMIPILASLLREIDLRPNKIACNEKLRIWYWSSVFSEAYSGAVDTRLVSDFQEMCSWFDNENQIPRTVERIRREFQATLNLSEIKSKQNAAYRGIMSLLALEGAPDFNTNQALENVTQNDQHHIFPKKSFAEYRNVNSILNLTWLSGETNKKIIGAKNPSVYIKKFLQERYDNDERKLLKTLKKHFIDKKAYDCMLKNDFDGFIAAREETILKKISELIGVSQQETPKSTLISPDQQFSNETAILEALRNCEDHIYWVDKYFSRKGMEWLAQSLKSQRVKTVKIIAVKKPKQEETKLLRDHFKKFRDEMQEKRISCELRVITDPKTMGIIHDRWLITKNTTYNLPSTDVIARGQYSEIKRDAQRPAFEKWWGKSIDIIDGWNDIV